MSVRSIIVAAAVRQAFHAAGVRVPTGFINRLEDLARGAIARAIASPQKSPADPPAARLVRRSTAIEEVRRRGAGSRMRSACIAAAECAAADALEREIALRRRSVRDPVQCIRASDLAAVLGSRRYGEPLLAAARRLGLTQRAGP